ncbi:hypothetical protein ACFL0T_05320 [Candidatus Omnitrophota bacterium]
MVVSVITLCTFLFNSLPVDTAWSYPAAGSNAVQSFNLNTFTLPQALGRIKDTHKTTSDKVVIHIQDAHCNYYAQHKINDIIEHLNQKYDINRLNLEGGSGDYNLSVFTKIKNTDIRRQVTDYFVKEGLVSGAEYYAINNPQNVKLWGVEDVKLYMEGLGIYRNALENKELITKQLNALKYSLELLKRNIYSPELQEFDDKAVEFKAGNLDLSIYLAYLIQKAEEQKIDVSNLQNIKLIRATIEQEEGIDFDKANEERTNLIRVFEDLFSKIEFEEITKKTLEYRLGQVTNKEFYEFLAERANEINIDLSEYSQLTKYIAYISKFESADSFKVMEEVTELEERIKTSLYKSLEQKQLALLDKNLTIQQNIFNFTLTPDDYRYYLDNQESFSAENFLQFIKEQDGALSGRINVLDGYREKVIKFYKIAFQRDKVFLESLQFSERSFSFFNKKPQIAVLITGGFHSNNLIELFKEQHISYISILPNFEHEKNYEAPYFKLLAGKASNPIRDKLLSAMSTMSIGSILSEAISKEVWDKANLQAIHAEVAVREIILDGKRVILTDVFDNSGQPLEFGTGEAHPITRRELFHLAHEEAYDKPMQAIGEAGFSPLSPEGLEYALQEARETLKTLGFNERSPYGLTLDSLFATLRGNNSENEPLIQFMEGVKHDANLGGRGIRINKKHSNGKGGLTREGISWLIHEIIGDIYRNHVLGDAIRVAYEQDSINTLENRLASEVMFPGPAECANHTWLLTPKQRLKIDRDFAGRKRRGARRQESDQSRVDVEHDFANYVGVDELIRLFSSANGAGCGVEFLTNRVHNPYRDFRDVEYAYKLQEDLVAKPKAVDELNSGLRELDILIDRALSGVRDWEHSQKTYDAQTRMYTQYLMPETGELPKFLTTVRSVIEKFDNPEIRHALKIVEEAIKAYNEIFPPDDNIFKRWRYDGSYSYVYSSAPKLSYTQKEFIKKILEELSLLAGNCILAKLRQEHSYKSASFGTGKSLLRVSNATNPVMKIEGEFHPISLEIDTDSRITVFSGLNTGGKSVTMKTTGLIALMVQAGIPVPGNVFMHEDMFSSFVRQGVDQYDIAAGEASQFAADLKASSQMVEKTGQRSFVIIDDDLFGGSSEPAITASCFGVTIERLKEKGAIALVASHQLRGLELLKQRNRDIRFLQVRTVKQADGLYASQYEFDPGIASSSHGLQETIRSKWPVAALALKYFNFVAEKFGHEKFEYKGKLGPKKVKPSKHRGYFYSRSERHFLEIDNFLGMLGREMPVEEDAADDDSDAEFHSETDKNRDDEAKQFAFPFMRYALAHPDEVDGSKWHISIQNLASNSEALSTLDSHLRINVEAEKTKIDPQMGEVKAVDIEATFKKLRELLAFCETSGIAVLEEYSRRVQAFLTNSGENERFMRYVQREGLRDALHLIINRDTPSDIERDFIHNICALYAVSSIAHFYKELEGSNEWSLAVSEDVRGKIDIEDGWHTTIANSPDKTPNDVNIARDGQRGSLSIYTGFNTGGKSTLAKMIAQIVTLAKLGWPVPAKNVRISNFSDIQVVSRSLIEQERMDYRRGRKKQHRGALETLLNKSRLVIQGATSSSLVILDEPFSGCTEPSVAASLTGALAEELTRRGATVILITHLLDVVPSLLENVPNSKCFMAETYKDSEGVKPRFNFAEGIAASSQGFEVAKNTGWFGYERALEFFKELSESSSQISRMAGEAILNSNGETFDEVWSRRKDLERKISSDIVDPRTWLVESEEEQVFVEQYERLSLDELHEKHRILTEKGDAVPSEKFIDQTKKYYLLVGLIDELSELEGGMAHYFRQPLNRMKILSSSLHDLSEQGRLTAEREQAIKEQLSHTIEFKVFIRELIKRWKRPDNSASSAGSRLSPNGQNVVTDNSIGRSDRPGIDVAKAQSDQERVTRSELRHKESIRELQKKQVLAVVVIDDEKRLGEAKLEGIGVAPDMTGLSVMADRLVSLNRRSRVIYVKSIDEARSKLDPDTQKWDGNTYFFVEDSIREREQQAYDKLTKEAFVWNLAIPDQSLCNVTPLGFLVFSIKFNELLTCINKGQGYSEAINSLAEMMLQNAGEEIIPAAIRQVIDDVLMPLVKKYTETKDPQALVEAYSGYFSWNLPQIKLTDWKQVDAYFRSLKMVYSSA